MRLSGLSEFYRRAVELFQDLGTPYALPRQEGEIRARDLASQAFDIGGKALEDWFLTFQDPLYRLADLYRSSAVFLYAPDILVRQARTLVARAQKTSLVPREWVELPRFTGSL